MNEKKEEKQKKTSPTGRALAVLYHGFKDRNFRPTAEMIEKADTERSTPSAEKLQALAEAGPLELHMLTFSDKDGYITQLSVYVSFIKDWNFPHEDAHRLALGTMQAAYYREVSGVYVENGKICGRFLPKDGIGKLTHPWDSGIFDKELDKLHDEIFQKLNDYAIYDKDGVMMISEEGMRNFYNDVYKDDARWKDTDYFYHQIGKAGNLGEMNLLFRRAADRELDGVPYISLTVLYQFFKNSAPVVADIKRRQFPKSTPTSSVSSESKEISHENLVNFYGVGREERFFKGVESTPSSLAVQEKEAAGFEEVANPVSFKLAYSDSETK